MGNLRIDFDAQEFYLLFDFGLWLIAPDLLKVVAKQAERLLLLLVTQTGLEYLPSSKAPYS